MLRVPRSILLLLLGSLMACGTYQPVDDFPPQDPNYINPNDLSESFLQGLKGGEDVQEIVARYAAYEPSVLAAALNTREEKLAFWVNTYNGMVQYLLTENPSLYDDRGKFFSSQSFTVAGRKMSPNEMEHGIIRGGENRLGLGFIPQVFTDKFERTFGVDGGDSRVHFALNCGAADCPPVAIYQPSTYNEQIEDRVRKYLTKHSEIKEENGKEVIYTSPLFSWFRGDFRDHDGVDDFLVTYDIVPEAKKDLKREYTDYDWTLKTGIWAE